MKKILLYAVLSLIWLPLAAQERVDSARQKYPEKPVTEKKFDREVWAEAVKELEYERPLKEEPEEIEGSREGTEMPSWLAFLLKVIFILLGLAFLAFLLLQLLGKGDAFFVRDRKVAESAPEVSVENVEEHLFEAGLPDMIVRAEQAERYAEAVRLHYLQLIRRLAENGRIRWKPDKTNRDYWLELSGTALQSPFAELTRAYEEIWYGERSIEPEGYRRLAVKFEAFAAG